MTGSYVWHDLFIFVTWLVYMCDMIHATKWQLCCSLRVRDSVWHDWFICVTWIIHMLDMTERCHTLVHMCNMTLSYVGHDSCHTYEPVCVTWIIHMLDMTDRYVQHDSFICWTWLICNMTHSCVWHDLYATWLIHMCDMMLCAIWLIHMCDMTHSYVHHDSFICVDMTRATK